jgi:hypothetical protein
VGRKLIVTIIVSILLITVVIVSGGCFKKNKTIENNSKSQDQENTVNGQSKTKEEDNNEEDNEKINEEVVEADTNISFVKNALDKSVEVQFSTPWITSDDGNYDVCIEGRGEDGIEEDIGKIYLKENNSQEKWAFEIEDGGKQLSPKKIIWIDNSNVAVIVGFAYGTIEIGGDVYNLDIQTGKVTMIYYTGDDKINVVDMNKNVDKLELKLLVYEDDNYIESHLENMIVDLN